VAGASPRLRARRPLAAAALLVGLTAAPGAAQPGGEPSSRQCAPESLPAAAELEAAGYRIGEIVVCPEAIFAADGDGEREPWLYRAADSLHRDTRAPVVERQLLFRTGDRFRLSLLAESERLLRAGRNFRSARIAPIRVHDGVVDVGVTTRENWSLKPSIGFKRSGGANRSHFEIQETNLLGLGKELTFLRETNVDRSALLVRYGDPQILGTRLRGEIAFSENSDGRMKLLALERPFFALDTRWSAGIRLADASLEEARYELGDVRDRFRRRDELIEGWLGWSRGLVDGATTRFRIGFAFDESSFRPTRAYPLAELPGDRKLAYPWVSWQRLEDRFVVERDIDRIERAEDVNLGWNASARLGWSSNRWGADREALLFEGAATRGWRPTPRQLLFPSFALKGRLDRGAANPFVASVGLRWHLREAWRLASYASVGLDWAHELEPDQQLLLGGDNGLRGYALRYQEGDRRALLTLEQRWYGEREFLKLVRFGAAAFLDLGRAWFAGRPAGAADRGWLADVGVGLRLAPSRTSHGNVIRLEVAFPLHPAPGTASPQYLVTTSASF
jgi:hypothetical protein